MAKININELPENILLELFTHVPARQLLLRCRPVCSLWRDLIDLVTLWKRKCLRDGFITRDWDQPVADWKIFYFLRSLQRNLLHNPCAEEGFEFWSLDVNGGDEWKVEDLSKDQRKEFPNDQHLPQVPGSGPQGRRVLGGADGQHPAGHRGQGLVCSQARLRVQVPAVRSAPVIRSRTTGDLPARPCDDPAEERCQVEGGLPHILQLPTRRPLHLVSARWRGHSLLGRLVRAQGHQQQHHHRAPASLTPPESPSTEP
ncbi:PREDICTED: F-box only protein 44 isoform X1 [Dipodomys ordii]|uniref:F-box only protein 44 isoform X1 n=1 Tax=Dipodomys ordii TaxID=10020 RepID=A0A1S3GDC8_DIPOR|nr:PREDICTED: F-box only protein 44 isoform X1 [Dipodomys ordii]XP_012886713.1 PREDICTED: F-box only protein 44 isoform X1 [Dipodomys ordii]